VTGGEDEPFPAVVLALHEEGAAEGEEAGEEEAEPQEARQRRLHPRALRPQGELEYEEEEDREEDQRVEALLASPLAQHVLPHHDPRPTHVASHDAIPGPRARSSQSRRSAPRPPPAA